MCSLYMYVYILATLHLLTYIVDDDKLTEVKTLLDSVVSQLKGLILMYIAIIQSYISIVGLLIHLYTISTYFPGASLL